MKFSLEKNLKQYSSVGVWLVIALIALIYNKFKYFNHKPSLMYKGSIGWKLSSKRLRKCLSLKSNTWVC